ncbi:zinc ABC transporter substrate-binding protein [Brachybacterium sp. NBEC-018]|uniref:metal ABC transporter solute-binding protein, Zn/Mn family n=1 Tax=Brachybacterium sp. NBEC-018 TaxID=2996004 RepID=UPI0021750A95|nr:zinc ABC transporter substrate-binding protein [Brachybacterium sp. NBEC-018]UVY85050.1 zinc ABC transporter substrate-binding protein [Brachybacterium sp. NBEC-018]
MNRRTLLVSTSIAAALTLAGCGAGATAGTGSASDGASGASDGGGGLAVVASTDVWGDVAASVGGEHVQVTSLITDPEADPHEYEASTRNQLAVSKAAVVIANGGGYDDFIDRMLDAAGDSSATVLNAVEISGRTATGGEELNEHVWYDLPTVQKVIDRLISAFSEALPEQAEDFARNGAALKTSVGELLDREDELKGAGSGRGVAITEPVPLYMLEAIGLENRTPAEFSEAVEEGEDVSVTVLQEVLALLEDRQVDLLAYNEQAAGPQTEQVQQAAEDAGIPVVPFTETLPKGQDYVTWMGANLDALAQALGA